MITELGKALDPIADKLTHGALAVCLATRYPLMWVLIVLMIIKEGYMGIQGLIFLKKENAGWRNVVWKGLYSNAFAGMLILFLFPVLPLWLVNGMICVMMAVMLVTLCLYVPVLKDERRITGNRKHKICACGKFYEGSQIRNKIRQKGKSQCLSVLIMR